MVTLRAVDPFEHEAHFSSGAQPKFSIHDPAFKKDPQLKRLRTPLLVSYAAFGIAMMFGVVGFFVVITGDAGIAGSSKTIVASLIGAFVLGSVVSSLVLSIMVRRGLNRFYSS